MYRYLVELGANTYATNFANQTCRPLPPPATRPHPHPHAYSPGRPRRPVLLAVACGSRRMVSAAMEATHIPVWTFGPVKCVKVPLYEVESHKESTIIDAAQDRNAGGMISMRDSTAAENSMLQRVQSSKFAVSERVRHDKKGWGTVVERMEDGRTRVRFDDGQEHRYRQASIDQLKLKAQLSKSYQVPAAPAPTPLQRALSPSLPTVSSPRHNPKPRTHLTAVGALFPLSRSHLHPAPCLLLCTPTSCSFLLAAAEDHPAAHRQRCSDRPTV